MDNSGGTGIMETDFYDETAPVEFDAAMEQFNSQLRECVRDEWGNLRKGADRKKYGWDANPLVWVIGFTPFTVAKAE